jgi:hypothetical protein
VIARPKPKPDDGPEPELVTPKRAAAELLAIASRASQLRIRARSLALYLTTAEARECLADLASTLATAGDRATDLATAIRVGQVVLDERYLDPSCRPPRPLLDAIEAAPLARVAAAIAPVVAARPADADGWPASLVALPSATGADVDQFVGQAVRPPPVHPAAGPARKAASRRKSQTAKGGDS